MIFSIYFMVFPVRYVKNHQMVPNLRGETLYRYT